MQYDGAVLIGTAIDTEGIDEGVRNLKDEFGKVVSSAGEAGKKIKEAFQESMKEAGHASGYGYDAKAMAAVFGSAAGNIRNYAEAVGVYGNGAGRVMNQLDTESQKAASSTRKAAAAGKEAGDSLEGTAEAGKEAAGAMKETAAAGTEAGNAMEGVANSSEAAGESLETAAEAGRESMVGLKDSVIWGLETVKNGLISAYQNLPGTIRAGLDRLPEIAKKAFGKLAGIGRSAFLAIGNTAGKAVRKLAGAAKSLVKHTGKMAKALLGLNKSARSTGNGLLSSFKTLLKYAVGIRTLFALFNRIRSGIKEGMENLAQYSDETNRSISALLSSLTMLKNSFAAAFSPILEVVSPLLVNMINLLAEATSRINQFFSALTGKKTFIKAVEVQEDYAESLRDTSKETKKAAKETQKALAPFDDLRQIQFEQNKEEEKPDSQKKPDPSQMFETVEIAEDIKQFADRLKALFGSGDFAGIGMLLGQKINEAISRISEWIDWENVGGRITEIVTKLTDMFNSLVATIDWEALGRMVGKGVNTIANTLYLLLTGIDWELLGNSLADGINGLVYEVDWDLFGATLGSFFMMKINLLFGFVERADWPAIGTALGRALMGLINEIDWNRFGGALGGLLQGAISMLYNFVVTADWARIGMTLGSMVMSLVNRIDWAQFGALLGKALSGIISTIHNFITTIDWTGLGKKISDTLNNFFSNVDWADLGSTLSDFARGLLEMLQTVLEQTDWEAIGEDIGVFLSNIDWWGIFSDVFHIVGQIALAVVKASWGLLKEVGQAMWEGFTKGIQEFSEDPGEWIREHIAEPFLNGVKRMFGIRSDSKSEFMQKIGGLLTGGLIDGLIEGIEGVTDPIERLKKIIENGFQNAFNGVKQIAINAINGIIDILNKIKFDIPDWVPELGGKSFGFNLKHVNFSGGSRAATPMAAYAAIPYNPPMLATGTVVPPRAGISYFGIGDNNKEPEVVSPLSTIEEGVMNALEKSGALKQSDRPLYLQIDGKTLARLLNPYMESEKTRVGVRMVTT